MENKKYDIAVYIGRFQPFHVGHRATIERAIREAEQVVVLIGSATTPRSPKNPFTFEERADMIQREFHAPNLHIEGQPDCTYRDEAWIADVGDRINRYVNEYCDTENPKIAIYGHKKDESSFYLDVFPQWDTIDTGKYDDEIIDATTIRDMYFGKMSSQFYSNTLPLSTQNFLKDFKKTCTFDYLVDEWEHIRDYDPTIYDNHIMVTTDAVVIQSGHVLLIKRKNAPGKGLWAMPGGHLNKGERILDGMMRELVEETNLRVPEDILRGSIKSEDVVDSVSRSQLGRIITHVFHIKLKDDKALPRVTGKDDAEEARWVPLSEFRQMQPVMFEDHWHIVNKYV